MASGDGDELGPAVFDAACSGDVHRLRKLVRFKTFSRVRESLSWRDSADRTPLLAAASMGHTDMVKILVEEYGVNVEESKLDNFTGEEFTPLVYAANVGHHKTVEVLLKKGAKVDHAYPLHRACFASSEGNLECVKVLIAHGADVNRKYTSEGELVDESTPLAVASEQVCPNIVEYLLQRGADPNIPDKDSNCPMHSAFGAIWNRHSESRCRGCCVKDGEKIIRMLAQHGARQTKNTMDLTPVMIGALTGNLLYVSDSLDELFNLPEGEAVQALQLMASHFLLSENHQVGLKILAKSLTDPENRPANLDDVKCPYGDFKEPLTIEDIEAIRADRTYLQVIALMIRERVLSLQGQKNYLWQAIRDFVDYCPPTPEGKQLALNALKHETNLEIGAGFFCGFALEGLCRLLDPKQVSLADSSITDVVILFKLAAINLSPDVTRMTHDRRGEAVQYHRFKSMNVLSLLSLYANYPLLSDADKEEVVTLTQQFVMAYDMTTDVMKQLREEDRVKNDQEASPLPGRGSNRVPGMSIFHVYVNVAARRQPTDEGNIRERFVTILLKCGVDPTQINRDGYNALHFLVKMCPRHSKTDTFRNGIVVPLVEWGCPILTRNPQTGHNAIDDCVCPDTKQLLMDLALPPLLKLAARVIRKRQIKYSKAVPAILASFLDMDV